MKPTYTFPEYNKDKESDVCPNCQFKNYPKYPSIMIPLSYDNPCIVCLWNGHLTKTNNFTEIEKVKEIV